MKSTADQQNSDLMLLHLLVGKKLKEDHLDNDAPSLADYSTMAIPTDHWGREEIQIRLDLGQKLGITLRSGMMTGGESDLDSLLQDAGDIAEAIDRLRRESEELKARIAEVKAVAKREIAKGRRRGLAYRFVAVAPAPVEVDNAHLYDKPVLLSVEILDHALREHTAEFYVESAVECVEIFNNMVEQQKVRAQSRAHLEKCGATGQVDAVVVNMLRHLGIDFADVMQLLRDNRDWIVDVPAGDCRIPIYWKDGTIHSQVRLDDNASWSEGTLSFRKAPKALGPKFVGQPASAVYSHPFLEEQTDAYHCSGKKGESGQMSFFERVYQFDLDTGAMWMADEDNQLRLAAAA